jgi:RNAse (barnase) inhibitor barstar
MTTEAYPAVVFSGNPAEEAERLKGQGVYVCELPGGIGSLEELHDALSRGLGFPEYYGRNWNALDEMLSDLAWLPAMKVAIVHHDLPSLERPELTLYLRILSEAANQAAAVERALICVLPVDALWVRQLLGASAEGLPSVH